ncbi:hypothetical protein SAMN05216332_101415 [Nitrosospira briensis]|nr:hypothetical protein SAMN05216332_101415 [Nitrosospira briensis]
MKLWKDFYDLVMPDVPGCTFAAIDSALRQSAVVFCEQSLAWRIELSPISVVAGIAEYALTPPEDAVVHAITLAALNGEEIEAYKGETDISARNRYNRTSPQYISGGPGSIILAPKPTATGALTMIVALKPSPASAGIDDVQFNEYREAIVHGALLRLMLSPKKPYTNAQLAAYHQQQFAIKTAAAGVRVAKNYARTPLRTSIMARR